MFVHFFYPINSFKLNLLTLNVLESLGPLNEDLALVVYEPRTSRSRVVRANHWTTTTDISSYQMILGCVELFNLAVMKFQTLPLVSVA